MATRFHQRSLRWLIGALLVALFHGGLTTVLVDVLGPRHVHRADLDPMAGWHDFRRAAKADSIPVPRAHEHAWLQRHHHDPGDADVLALDGATTAADDAGFGAGLVVFPATEAQYFHPAVTLSGDAPWPPDRPASFLSHAPEAQDRPPDA